MSQTLSGIALGSDRLALSPAFDPQINAYSVDVPEDVTSFLVTFSKAAYGTVWGAAGTEPGVECSLPYTARYIITDDTSVSDEGIWTPSAYNLHRETYGVQVDFSGPRGGAVSCVLTISIWDGTAVKQTEITFNRVSE